MSGRERVETGGADPATIVIGTGPVGTHCARTLNALNPQRRIALYGAEPRRPYNRLDLSSYLAGNLNPAGIENSNGDLAALGIDTLYGCGITAIDRDAKTVTDALGRTRAYDQLVLAVGSRPRIPEIPGIQRAGVFTFRDLDDAEKLAARRLRSRNTVIIGGGLLGLEIARAMRRFNTQVTVVEHSPYIMHKQLNVAAASRLAAIVREQRIKVAVNAAVIEVRGDERVESVVMTGGKTVACDTLIIAAGVVPNIDLAAAAGIAVGRGVRTDRQMRTSDESIFAIGGCAEVDGMVYGLASPGLEQARVAARTISGIAARFDGAAAAADLKVLSTPVFSVGEIVDQPRNGRTVSFTAADNRTYRVLTAVHGRIVGVAAVGEWGERDRVQELIRRRGFVWPWQLSRFRTTGNLWADSNEPRTSHWTGRGAAVAAT